MRSDDFCALKNQWRTTPCTCRDIEYQNIQFTASLNETHNFKFHLYTFSYCLYSINSSDLETLFEKCPPFIQILTNGKNLFDFIKNFYKSFVN